MSTSGMHRRPFEGRHLVSRAGTGKNCSLAVWSGKSYLIKSFDLNYFISFISSKVNKFYAFFVIFNAPGEKLMIYSYSHLIINTLFAKNSNLKLEGTIKKIFYGHRDYESVDEKSLS